MKCRRPRNRKPYRDNVLTVPCTPDRFKLEEDKIKSAWSKSTALPKPQTHTRTPTWNSSNPIPHEIILAPGQETKIEVDGIIHTIVNTTGSTIRFTPNFSDDYDSSKDN